MPNTPKRYDHSIQPKEICIPHIRYCTPNEKYSQQPPANKLFQVPPLELTLMDVVINIPPGTIRWSTFHRVHEKDLAIECHVKKASKISYQVFHPGNNKQSVPLALAIFDLSTISAISQYFPEEKTAYHFSI